MASRSNLIAVILFVVAAICFGLEVFSIPLGKLSLEATGFLFTAIGLAVWAWNK